MISSEPSIREAVLGIDVGGSFVKAVLFDIQSGDWSSSSRSVPTLQTGPGFVERDPSALWSTILDVVRGAVERSGTDPRSVVAVSVTSHGNGLYLVDGTGTPTMNPIQASDTRAKAIVDDLLASGQADALRPSTWNGVWAGQPAPLLSWLLRHDPDPLFRADYVMGCADYLRFRMTGVPTGEITGWSSSGMVDCNAGRFSDEVLETFGIAAVESKLLDFVGPLDIVGPILPGVAKSLGLVDGTPLVAGAVDNVALHTGAGVFDDSSLVVGTGTWSVNQISAPADQMTMDSLLGSVRPSTVAFGLTPGQALLIDASPTSASNLGWALDHVLKSLPLAASEAGVEPYEFAISAALRRRPGAFFLPFISGSRDLGVPMGAWTGLSSSDDDAGMARAVLEGICFEHRRHVERLTLGRTERIGVHLAGGATKNDRWTQLFADVLGRSMTVSRLPELGATGVAAMAGAAIGAFEGVDEAATLFSQEAVDFRPEMAATEIEEARYQKYCEYVDAVEGVAREAT